MFRPHRFSSVKRHVEITYTHGLDAQYLNLIKRLQENLKTRQLIDRQGPCVDQNDTVL